MQISTKRTTVDIDTRRKVVMAARSRKPAEVAKVPHEAFARNMLKDIMGWPRREPAPEQIKQVAKEIAGALNKAVLEQSKKVIESKEVA